MISEQVPLRIGLIQNWTRTTSCQSKYDANLHFLVLFLDNLLSLIMSSSPSAKQRKHPETSGKINFPSTRESPADTLPVHSRTGGRHLGADVNQTFGNLEEEAERQRPKRPPFFSFLSGRSKLVSLDDDLFRAAKTSQSQPNWPSCFGVPKDNAPQEHAALHASVLGTAPHLRATEGRTFYRGGKQRLNVMMKRNKAQARIIKHVQGML